MPDLTSSREAIKSLAKRIKVFGVGGAGINLIERMMKYPTPGAEVIAVHASKEALARSSAQKRFLLGRTGRSRARASHARYDAEEVKNDLLGLVLGADLVLIVAAAGGATGSGVAPVIARIAQRHFIHTVAVVAQPFEWETGVRRAEAIDSADRLACYADMVIETSNQSAAEMLCVEEIELEQQLDAVNDSIGGITAEIVGIVNAPGNAYEAAAGDVLEMRPLSFKDFQAVMLGKALVGTAVGAGAGRARVALLQALNCPLLEGNALSEAERILVSITTAPGALRNEEAKSIAELARSAAGHADLKFCATTNPNFGDRLRVTIFGVGLDRHRKTASAE